MTVQPKRAGREFPFSGQTPTLGWLHGSLTSPAAGVTDGTTGLAIETAIVIGMDPATGNILTADEIEMLGKRQQDMIPLSNDLASRLIAERREAAATLAERQTMERDRELRRKKNKAAKKARKNNR